MKKHIVIIGAGVNGLSLAIFLKQMGIKVYIYEKSISPRTEGTGIYIWPQGINILKLLIPGNELFSVSQSISHMQTRNINGDIIHSQKIAPENENEFAYMFHRKNLYNLLLKQLDSDQIIYGKKLVSIKNATDKTYAFFEDNTKIECDILIGADGLYSKVREFIFPQVKPSYMDITVLRGITQHILNKISDTCDIYAGEYCRIVTYPINTLLNEHYWFAACKNTNKKLSNNIILEKFSHFNSDIYHMIKNTPPNQIISSTLASVKIESWYKNNIILIGDAAHATLPTLGYGFTLGLENAYTLAIMFSKFSPCYKSIFSAYEKKTFQRTSKLMEIFDKITRLFYYEPPTQLEHKTLELIYRDFFQQQTIKPYII